MKQTCHIKINIACFHLHVILRQVHRNAKHKEYVFKQIEERGKMELSTIRIAKWKKKLPGIFEMNSLNTTELVNNV